MKLFDKDLDHDIVVIAEIGVNHEGDLAVAEELVLAAANAGADAVKFQSYTPERFASITDSERFARATRFALTETDHRHLARVAQDIGIVFFSTAVSEDWVPLIAELSPAIKISSGDLTFEPVIRAAARTGKLVILSTGAGDFEEIDHAVEWVRQEVGGDKLNERLALMHCVSAYPAPVQYTNLRAIPAMRHRYGLEVGWSNHVIGPEICVAAVGLGARIVEVHVTDQKRGRVFRDHELSFEPQELAALVRSLKAVNSALGNGIKRPADCEIPVRDTIRKGIIAARNLPQGHRLSAEDLMFARPATGIPSTSLDEILGRVLSAPVPKLQPLKREDLG